MTGFAMEQLYLSLIFYLFVVAYLSAGGFDHADASVKMAAVGYTPTIFLLTLFFVWLLLYTFNR